MREALRTAGLLEEMRGFRAGSMDSLEVVEDGDAQLFTLAIEGHASMITKASQSSYLDQPKFDPSDTSQAYAVSIANNPNGPGSGTGAVGGVWAQLAAQALQFPANVNSGRR